MTTRTRLVEKGLRLEYFTIGYNIVEAAVSIVFGYLAGSIALIGFGFDSIVESLSGLVLIWRLRQDADSPESEAAEARALKFVATTFFILAAYILYESIERLLSNEPADPSLPGIAIATASLIVMPILAAGKRSVGEAIDSKALVADSKETLVCAWLSAALLLGLVANYAFGFWQADPLAGLVIVGFLVKEGRELWLGDT